MEDSQVAADLPSEEDRAVMTLGEWLDKLCAFYICIGVPYEEYWYGDYTKLKYYLRRFETQQKMQNEQAWLSGIYTYAAVATALGNAFRKKGDKAQDYLEKPLQIYPKTEEEKRYEAEMERRKIIERLNKWKAAWDRAQQKAHTPVGLNQPNGETNIKDDTHGSS